MQAKRLGGIDFLGTVNQIKTRCVWQLVKYKNSPDLTYSGQAKRTNFF